VHAGLAIVDAFGALNTRLGRDCSSRLAVRVGIHTGLVVVGVISAAPHQLVQGLFTCQALATLTVKGVAQPLAVYDVRGTSEAQNRFEVAVTRGLTPRVGR
jgi:class 3 adenylate cyclase